MRMTMVYNKTDYHMQFITVRRNMQRTYALACETPEFRNSRIFECALIISLWLVVSLIHINTLYTPLRSPNNNHITPI